MSLSSVARRLSGSADTLDIIQFTESKAGVGQKLFPVQAFLLKLLEKMPLSKEKTIELRDQFNSVTLRYLSELEYYQYLYDKGSISMPYEEHMDCTYIQYMIANGRRGTKSTTTGIWVAYQLYKLLQIYNPQEYFGIIGSDSMNITLTSLGERNASKLFIKLAEIIKRVKFFRPYLLRESNTMSLSLWSRHDLDTRKHLQEDQVSKAVTPGASITVQASANTQGIRGDSNLFAIMEEFAHFLDPARSVRDKPLDELVYDALVPSISGFRNPDGTPYGRVLIPSSPNGQRGKFYRDYRDAFERRSESGILALAIPTWEINPSVGEVYLKTFYNQSPSTFRQEYGAEFTEGGQNWIRNLGKYYASVDTRLNPKLNQGQHDRIYFGGCDIALSSDGTAVSLVHWEPNYRQGEDDFCAEAFSYNTELKSLLSEQPWIEGERLVVDYTEVRYAGKPPYERMLKLDIKDVFGWISEVFKNFPIQLMITDQWAGAIIEQFAAERGLKRFQILNHSQDLNDMMYKLFMQLLMSGTLVLPNDPSLHKELLALVETQRSKDVIKVEAPPGGNLHDDRFDSLIRACWLAFLSKDRKNTYSSKVPLLYSNNLNTSPRGAFGLTGQDPFQRKRPGTFNFPKGLKKYR